MATYRYLVLNAKGVQCEKELEATSEADARRRLQRQGFTPIREAAQMVKTFRAPAAIRTQSTFGKMFQKSGKFDVNTFTNRLAPLLEANVPLEKALAVIEEGTRDSKTLQVLFELRRGLHEGKRFSELIRKMDREFPPIYSSLVETGEEAGCMPQVLNELRRFLNESKAFRDFVVTSSIYPVIVTLVTFVVVVLLFTVFIPRFARIFADQGKSLPLLTQIMLDISNFMVGIWWFWPLLIVGVVVLKRAAQREGKLKQCKDRLLLHLPLLNTLVISLQVGRFIQTLSIMVKNHVHLLPAVRIARRTLDNSVIAASFESVEGNLRGGNRLSDILSSSPYMPPGANAMLKISEQSGEVGEMLERIALEEQENTRIKVKKLLAALEPAVILVLALIVMTVVLAVFLAIWQMNSIK